MKKKFPKSLRKYIREEKARIRREFLNLNEQEEKIKKFLESFYKESSKEKN